MKKVFYKKKPKKENFYENYLKARKEYFNYFYSRHQQKKEEAYLEALKKYRQSHSMIPQEYPPVLDYSKNHQQEAQKPFNLETFKRVFLFSEDQEISIGTLEDYSNYKASV